jgi:deaminated glutathione amidase
MTTLRAATIQMQSTPDVARNLDAAYRLVGRAARDHGAQLAVLPEYFCVMGHGDEAKLHVAERDINGDAEVGSDGPIQRALAAMAREHRLWIVGGTLPLRTADPARARNACCVFAPDGTRAARYDKIHLFRYANARESYDEARTLEPGDTPTVVTARIGERDWRIGLTVCYDLRFPELYRGLCDPPCDIVTVPAAFTHTTGQAHWEVLLRARAIENQCCVIASAQAGKHENGRRTWGHSMIVDPWGEVIAQCESDGEGIAVATIDAARIEAVRAQLPALTHRRRAP